MTLTAADPETGRRGRPSLGDAARRAARAVRPGNVAARVLAAWAGAAALYAAGALEAVELRLIEARHHLVDRAPGGGVVLVEIDRRSIDALGVWPWPRRLHALALDRLTAAGAGGVLFDIDFSAATTPADDAALARALARASPPAALAVFRDPADTRSAAGVGPSPAFLDVATPVAVDVAPESDGRIWRVAPLSRWRDRPIAALFAEAAGGAAGDAPFWIDYGVDPGGLPALSFVDVARGAFDPAIVAGRRVVIGATAIELSDLVAVPRHGVLPGVVVQILAAESALADRRLRRTGPAAALLAAGAVALAAGAGLRRGGFARGLSRTAAIGAAAVAAAFGAQAVAPVILDLAPMLAALAITVPLTLQAQVSRLGLRLLAGRLALGRADALMRRVADSMAEGLITVDAAGRLLKANRAAQGMFLPARAGGGAIEPQRHCLWPRLRDGRAVAAALAGAEGAGRRRMIGRRGDGGRFYAEIAVARLADREGAVFVATVHDVTATIRAERAARRRARALLAMTVRAEAATRAKSQFVATMSHELRTPLNAIIGFAAILAEEGEVAPAARVAFAREIEAGGERLLRLLTLILDYAEADLDRGAIERAPTDLGALVRDAVALQRPHAAAKGLGLALEAPEGPLVVGIDGAAIAKALDAILRNAITFTAAGGVAVALRAEDGGATIRVADTGPGMPADFLRVCCEPFAQLDGSATRRFEGAGLGLTVAKSFVERHGGTLSIESAPGRGTTVSIALPAGAPG